MTLTKTTEGSKLTIAIAGRLDTMTSPELDKELKGCLDGVTELVFDFTSLTYVSSAGLRVLLFAQKQMDSRGTMTVINCCEEVKEVFEVTGFDELLTIV